MTILRKYFDFKEIKQHSIINKLSNIYSISEGASQVPNYKTNLEKTGIKYSFFYMEPHVQRSFRSKHWKL